MKSNLHAVRLRSLRKRSGLNQEELAHILGFRSGAPVSRHERSESVPDLLTALAYGAIFRIPISEIFPGLCQTIETEIEEHLAKLETDLGRSTAKGRNAFPVARKLEFLCERRDPVPHNSTS